MNKLTIIFFVLVLLCLIGVGYSASLVNEYRAFLPGMELEAYTGYNWEYLVALIVFIVVIFFVLWPFGQPKYCRWLLCFLMFLGAAFYLLVTAMHSPPVHIHLFYLGLAGSFVSLFMAGYSLGVSHKSV